ncbi:hypothetical protein U91I_03793 [alpha proteobacterium U9-1i]|nr:hypothetical protein U91I_03793 [alpha proteobacterium U9-1i]
MKFRSALLVAMLVGLSACASPRDDVYELPGGVDPEAENQVVDPPNWFERMLGQDDRPNAGTCPLAAVLYDNSRLVAFDTPGTERYASITHTGELTGVRSLCRYVDADPINMTMEIDMAFGRGPAATSDRQTYRYWVAVARRGRMPIEKVYFDIDVRFPRGQTVVTRTEEIERIQIPRANADVSGENFEVLVGFELTPEQLQFNRDGKRFRVDAGANPSE